MTNSHICKPCEWTNHAWINSTIHRAHTSVSCRCTAEERVFPRRGSRLAIFRATKVPRNEAAFFSSEKRATLGSCPWPSRTAVSICTLRTSAAKSYPNASRPPACTELVVLGRFRSSSERVWEISRQGTHGLHWHVPFMYGGLPFSGLILH